ncbi:hypothetical protein GGF32_003736 [Allomyces javanicus]|nr:hypothetical protein GGF32_003736 [Allomyces javanicus]
MYQTRFEALLINRAFYEHFARTLNNLAHKFDACKFYYPGTIIVQRSGMGKLRLATTMAEYGTFYRMIEELATLSWFIFRRFQDLAEGLCECHASPTLKGYLRMVLDLPLESPAGESVGSIHVVFKEFIHHFDRAVLELTTLFRTWLPTVAPMALPMRRSSQEFLKFLFVFDDAQTLAARNAKLFPLIHDIALMDALAVEFSNLPSPLLVRDVLVPRFGRPLWGLAKTRADDCMRRAVAKLLNGKDLDKDSLGAMTALALVSQRVPMSVTNPGTAAELSLDLFVDSVRGGMKADFARSADTCAKLLWVLAHDGAAVEMWKSAWDTTKRPVLAGLATHPSGASDPHTPNDAARGSAPHLANLSTRNPRAHDQIGAQPRQPAYLDWDALRKHRYLDALYSVPVPFGTALAQLWGTNAVADIAAAADTVPHGRDMLTQGLASFTHFVAIDYVPTRQDLPGYFTRCCAVQLRAVGGDLLLIPVLVPTHGEHRVTADAITLIAVQVHHHHDRLFATSSFANEQAASELDSVACHIAAWFPRHPYPAVRMAMRSAFGDADVEAVPALASIGADDATIRAEVCRVMARMGPDGVLVIPDDLRVSRYEVQQDGAVAMVAAALRNRDYDATVHDTAFAFLGGMRSHAAADSVEYAPFVAALCTVVRRRRKVFVCAMGMDAGWMPVLQRKTVGKTEGMGTSRASTAASLVTVLNRLLDGPRGAGSTSTNARTLSLRRPMTLGVKRPRVE